MNLLKGDVPLIEFRGAGGGVDDEILFANTKESSLFLIALPAKFEGELRRAFRLGVDTRSTDADAEDSFVWELVTKFEDEAFTRFQNGGVCRGFGDCGKRFFWRPGIDGVGVGPSGGDFFAGFGVLVKTVLVRTASPLVFLFGILFFCL